MNKNAKTDLVDVVREKSDVDSSIWIIEDFISLTSDHPEESCCSLDVDMFILEGQKVSRISIDDGIVFSELNNCFDTIFLVDDFDGFGALDQLALGASGDFLGDCQLSSCVSVLFSLKVSGINIKLL